MTSKLAVEMCRINIEIMHNRRFYSFQFLKTDFDVDQKGAALLSCHVLK